MITEKNKLPGFNGFIYKEYCFSFKKIPGSVKLIVLGAFSTVPVLAQNNLKPGQTFRDCKSCPEMVVIPAGSFTMNCPSGKSKRFNEEGPEHQVSIRQFAVGKFEITRGQWAAFVSATNRKTNQSVCEGSGFSKDKEGKASWRNPGFPQGDNHPVVCVTLKDVQDYTRWLSRRAGGNYRLLTEAEWEYMARAASTGSRNPASAAGSEYASYAHDSGYTGAGSAPESSGWAGTSPVGSFPPNAFGVYDINSNVFQWVEDCFASSYSGVPADGCTYKVKTPLSSTNHLSVVNGTSSYSNHIISGGDGSMPVRMIRSSYREWVPTPGTTLKDYRSAGLGFRVARTL